MSFWVQIPLHTCTFQIMLYCGWDIGRCSSHLKLGSECQWIMAASHGSAYCQVAGLSFVRLVILVTYHQMPSLQLDPSYSETLFWERSQYRRLRIIAIWEVTIICTCLCTCEYCHWYTRVPWTYYKRGPYKVGVIGFMWLPLNFIILQGIDVSFEVCVFHRNEADEWLDKKILVTALQEC